MITLWLFNIAMENGPFIDGLPIKNGDFPWRTVKQNSSPFDSVTPLHHPSPSPLSITPLHHPSPSPLSIWHHLCFQLFQVPPCPSHSFSTTSGRCRKCSRYPTSGNPCEPDKGSHSLRDAKQTATTDKGNIWKYHSKIYQNGMNKNKACLDS